MSRKAKFGESVRRERELKDIGLREMARMIGVSATYLSKVERDEFLPPTENKVRAIAAILGRDVDELLALANRVSSDLTDIIKNRPREMASFLRAVDKMSAEELTRLPVWFAGAERAPGTRSIGTGERSTGKQ